MKNQCSLCKKNKVNERTYDFRSYLLSMRVIGHLAHVSCIKKLERAFARRMITGDKKWNRQ